jgi:chromosome partitioning protein
MIILIGGEKGGTGKTTISTNIAAMMVQKDLDILLVDTDKQGSASDWCSVRNENNKVKRISCIQKFGISIASEILHLSKKYEHIIIDAGGRDSVELRSAMAVADKLYIPIQASQFDVWTLGSVDSLVTTAKALNPKLQSFVILNRASTNPMVSETKEIQETFEGFENLKLLDEMLYERISYRKAARSGLGVNEVETIDTKACEEVTSIYNSIGLQPRHSYDDAMRKVEAENVFQPFPFHKMTKKIMKEENERRKAIEKYAKRRNISTDKSGDKTDD